MQREQKIMIWFAGVLILTMIAAVVGAALFVFKPTLDKAVFVAEVPNEERKGGGIEEAKKVPKVSTGDEEVILMEKVESKSEAALPIDRQLVSESEQKTFAKFKTDLSLRSIELNQLFDGGPGKDGIPALTNPTYQSVEETTLPADMRGMLVMNKDKTKKWFYPYSIMVWHEIVNDTLDGTDIAVTFCPLCGSAIVYERNIDGKTLNFAVSGKLFESNLVMYDKQTESLWSQARGEAIVGEYTNTKLTKYPFQLLTWADVQEKHEDAQVLSENTGHKRDYKKYPYGNYEQNVNLFFPISEKDDRFPLKTLFYVFEADGKSIAIPSNQLTEGTFTFDELTVPVTLTNDENGITIQRENKEIPGYYEMWFSWAAHHQDDGLVWELNK